MSKLFESYADYDEFRKHARSLQQVGAATWAVAGSTLTGRGPAHTVLAIPVSENFFDILGVNAAQGRTFAPMDLSHGCSIVLSNAFWLDSLGADPNVVGTAITLNNRSCTVIGVMPGTFEFYPQQTQLWTLLTPDFIPSPEKLPLIPFARLKPCVNREQAQAEPIALHTALHRKDPLERELRPSVSNRFRKCCEFAARTIVQACPRVCDPDRAWLGPEPIGTAGACRKFASLNPRRRPWSVWCIWRRGRVSCRERN